VWLEASGPAATSTRSCLWRSDEAPGERIGMSTRGNPQWFQTVSGGNRKPAVSSGFLEADEGTRTLDLLHGKQTL
jgi:hypothetical protein